MAITTLGPRSSLPPCGEAGARYPRHGSARLQQSPATRCAFGDGVPVDADVAVAVIAGEIITSVLAA